jgi:translation initiation factor 1A
MPKATNRKQNKKMANKNKEHKKKKGAGEEKKEETLFRDEDQEYGQIQKILGERRAEVLCFDGLTRICKFRKSKRKKKQTEGIIVLISLRDFCDKKADIIHVYDSKDVKILEEKVEIPRLNKDEKSDAFCFKNIDEDEENSEDESTSSSENDEEKNVLDFDSEEDSDLSEIDIDAI